MSLTERSAADLIRDARGQHVDLGVATPVLAGVGGRVTDEEPHQGLELLEEALGDVAAR